MARIFRYLSHPQVLIDPDVPVPDWGLSERGRERTRQFRASPVLQGTSAIYSSAERKARETAEILADAQGLRVIVRDRSHENDRSSTGFLKPDEFEMVADQFFAEPAQSVRGWERALDAQMRIVSEARRIMNDPTEGDILMVGHGGVGTLLFCHLSDLEIDRKYDQAGGGGNVFAFDLRQQEMLHAWTPMEHLSAPG